MLLQVKKLSKCITYEMKETCYFQIVFLQVSKIILRSEFNSLIDYIWYSFGEMFDSYHKKLLLCMGNRFSKKLMEFTKINVTTIRH